MKAPAFWQKRGVISHLLWPLGWLYGQATLWRMMKKGYKSSLPVFCVGNATLGGTGKTPVVLALYKLLTQNGHKPVILTRGYGGSVKMPTLVAQHAAQEVGDEAKMMSLSANVIVSSHRAQGAKRAEALGFNCIIMDDGLQNPQLEKDFCLLVHDSEALSNGFTFPAGNYRAPLNAQLPLVDALVLTGEKALANEKPSFKTKAHIATDLLRETPLLAFCGIGRPEKFQQTLINLGFKDIHFVAFSDHHAYTKQDVAHLEKLAQERTLITTQKDAVKWPKPIETVLFELVFEDEVRLEKLLLPHFAFNCHAVWGDAQSE
jgi:tetraacyldisaccharide 4'-kinase